MATYTYNDVVSAVYYAQQKPEELAAMVCKALGITVPEKPVFRVPVKENTPTAEETPT